MKPRSKRNRKRPRSEVNGLKEDPVYETVIRPLELDGKPVYTEKKWLRVIKPYPYTYSTFAKARWEGRTILDVYSTEFGSYPKSYYETAIGQGRILVSDQKVSTSYIIKGGDVLSHTVHRHEPGVAVASETEPHITILKETSDLVVVEKPGTMPVHPCGGYNMQSLMNILEAYYSKGSGTSKLYTIHRLDRLTSGLVILSKTSSVAKAYSKSIMDRSCQKVYLARVTGKFPLKWSIDERSERTGIPLHGEWSDAEDPRSDPRSRNALAYWMDDGGSEPTIETSSERLQSVFESRHSVDEWLRSMDPKKDSDDNGTKKLWFHLACPTRIAKHKDGVCEAGSFEDLENELYNKTVKPAHSSFGVVSYDESTDSTLLVCRPYTGRTHQLRLHLQYLQHPIANDPNYGGDIWYGNPCGKQACRIAQNRLNVINNSEPESSASSATTTTMGNKKQKDTLCSVVPRTSAIDVPATENEVQEGIANAMRQEQESIHSFIERTCVWCARSRSVPSDDRAVLEFVIRSPGIWLHALQYSFTTSKNNGDEKPIVETFRANLPDWYDLSSLTSTHNNNSSSNKKTEE